jgi:hypothetical protein
MPTRSTLCPAGVVPLICPAAPVSNPLSDDAGRSKFAKLKRLSNPTLRVHVAEIRRQNRKPCFCVFAPVISVKHGLDCKAMAKIMNSGTTRCRAPCESGTVYKYLECVLNIKKYLRRIEYE